MVARAADGPGPPLGPGRDLLAGLFMTAAGLAGLLAPSWFADTAGFPRHTHFVHDAGTFQLGIGLSLLLAVAWRDGLALALAGFLVANSIHPAANPVLARFVRQKTVPVATYRHDGRPVSLAVDGDHAYLRSFEQAGKTRRIRHNPRGTWRPPRPVADRRPGHPSPGTSCWWWRYWLRCRVLRRSRHPPHPQSTQSPSTPTATTVPAFEPSRFAANISISDASDLVARQS